MPARATNTISTNRNRNNGTNIAGRLYRFYGKGECGNVPVSFPNQYNTEVAGPMLFITGDVAHSKEFSEEAVKRAAEPRELFYAEGASHVDGRMTPRD